MDLQENSVGADVAVIIAHFEQISIPPDDLLEDVLHEAHVSDPLTVLLDRAIHDLCHRDDLLRSF